MKRDIHTGISLEPRVVTVSEYGNETRHIIDPLRFATPILSAQLADAWVELCSEMVSTPHALATSIRRFCRSMATQLKSVDSEDGFSLADLRRRHLDVWENELLADPRTKQTDTNYRHIVHTLALLRRIHDDRPGTLHEDVLLRLEQPARLRHVRNEGTAPFTPRETSRIRSRAHKVVYDYTTETHPLGPSRDELVALHILLSLATGEPPEVLRQLTMTRLTASADDDANRATRRMTPEARVTWLAEHHRIESLTVTYVKNRAGGERRTEVYTRQNRAAYEGFRTLLSITGRLRQSYAGDSSLWLYRTTRGTTAEAAWNSQDWSLAAWLERHDCDIEGPAWFQRFRKVVVAREAQAQGALYLRRETRHTSGVFFKHYTQSSVLRAHAGKLLIDTIQGYFDAAVRPPLVITPAAEELLRQGARVDDLPDATVDKLLSGELEGPHTACIDPLNSPFDRPNIACGRSMTGMCFGCENAIITRDHLPAALLIRELSDPAKTADPAMWKKRWRDLHLLITDAILPAFPAEAVAEAEHQTHHVPIDMGIANDMRGLARG